MLKRADDKQMNGGRGGHKRPVKRGLMSYILAIDQGTTSSRSMVFDAAMNVVASAQRPLPIHTPNAGWVEQDAEEMWAGQMATIHEVLSRAGLVAEDIAAIGIANQRETTVVWHKHTGKPIAPAIVWQDRRTQAWCEAQVEHADLVQRQTGLRLDPYFSASKLVWLLANTPQARQQAQAGDLLFGTVDTWLVWQLSRGERHVVDVSNASRTMLMDIHTGTWSEELCAAWDIPMQMLPEIVPSSGELAHTATGLFARPIPIAAIMGDQQAALFGHACDQAGMAKNTYGTGCFMLLNTGESVVQSQHHMLSTVAWQQVQHRTCYALEGSVFMAGAIVQWLRDNLGLIAHSADIEPLAASVDSSAGVTLLPAFTGMGAPYWRADMQASLHGLNRGTTKAHIARAALEAIAFQVSDVLLAMQQDAPMPLQELRVDGGAANNDLLMQFQADLLGVPVLRPKITETTALGVAKMAAMAVGLVSGNSGKGLWQLQRQFEPQMGADEREHHLQRWQQIMQAMLNM